MAKDYYLNKLSSQFLKVSLIISAVMAKDYYLNKLTLHPQTEWP